MYDATGKKLKKILKKGGAVIKTTSYIGDLVYEGTTDKFLNTEEGRVVLMENGQAKEEYQYHLKDHLGNVRVTFTTADREQLTELYMATMEPEFAELEESTFNNLETRQVDELHNKTEGGKASARLNAAKGKAVGPSMSLKVMPGDTVRMKVYAQYHEKARTKEALAGMASIVASAFTPEGAPAEAATIITQALRQPLGGAGRLALFAKDNTIPKAYLNYLFFDKDMNYKTGGFKQVTEEGLGRFEELSLEFAPEEEGWLMIYTANQTAEDLDVYFDQMTVAHTSGPIVRVDDYYPFGMTFNTGELAGALTNKYLYQGKEIQNELGLDTYDFGLRMYDPAIARTFQLDPAADLFKSLSPYSWSGNNPIRMIDPSGAVFGDFYDENGKKIGTDGRNDGKVYVVADKNEAKSIKQTDKSGGTTEAKNVNSAVELPSNNVRQKMGDAVDRSNSPTTAAMSNDPNFVPDPKGGFHEEGGVFGKDAQGKDEAKPGSYSDPSVQKKAEIDVFSGETPQNALATYQGSYHVHPSGTVTKGNATSSFTQTPSQVDVTNATHGGAVTGNSYVLGAGNKTVYIYNQSGVVATFPLKEFRSIK